MIRRGICPAGREVIMTKEEWEAGKTILYVANPVAGKPDWDGTREDMLAVYPEQLGKSIVQWMKEHVGKKPVRLPRELTDGNFYEYVCWK